MVDQSAFVQTESEDNREAIYRIFLFLSSAEMSVVQLLGRHINV